MLAAAHPPPLPRAEPESPTEGDSGSPVLAGVLSCVLILFLGSAVLSLTDQSLHGWLGRTDLAVFSGIAFLLMLLAGPLLYGLMAFFPGIPKRFFMPLCLFIPAAYIGVLPLLVWFGEKAMVVLWAVALAQVLLGVCVILRLQGGLKCRWPLVPAAMLADRRFSWRNFAGVIACGFRTSW